MPSVVLHKDSNFLPKPHFYYLTQEQTLSELSCGSNLVAISFSSSQRKNTRMITSHYYLGCVIMVGLLAVILGVVEGVPLIAQGGRYPGGRSYGYGFREGYRGHNGYGQYGTKLFICTDMQFVCI